MNIISSEQARKEADSIHKLRVTTKSLDHTYFRLELHLKKSFDGFQYSFSRHDSCIERETSKSKTGLMERTPWSFVELEVANVSANQVHGIRIWLVVPIWKVFDPNPHGWNVVICHAKVERARWNPYDQVCQIQQSLDRKAERKFAGANFPKKLCVT